MSVNCDILENYVNIRHSELDKRLSFGIKYSLLNTKNYDEQVKNVIISHFDSSTPNQVGDEVVKPIPRIDCLLSNLKEKFQEHYNVMKKMNYEKRVEYLETIIPNVNKEIKTDIVALKKNYEGLIEAFDYFKSDNFNSEIFNNLELTFTQIFLDEDEAHYRRFSLENYLKEGDISRCLDPNFSSTKFLETLSLNKDSFEAAYSNGYKSKILKDIITSVLMKSEHEYLPKEVMDAIEAKYNFITFSDSNSNDKVFINKGTFNSVWYKTKNSLKDRNMYNPKTIGEADSIKESLTDILTGSEDNDLIFDNLSLKELSSLIPNYESLLEIKSQGEQGILSDLNPLLESEWKYSMLNDNLKSNVYPALFKRLENNYKNFVIQTTDKQALAEFCKNYKDKMVLSYGLDNGLSADESINNFSSMAMNLLGLPNNTDTFNLFVKEIKAFISNAGNAHSLLNLSDLKKKI